MGSSTVIGRVGALAVALGIGAAMTTGGGLAFADDGKSGGNDGGPTGGTGAGTTAPKRVPGLVTRVRDAADSVGEAIGISGSRRTSTTGTTTGSDAGEDQPVLPRGRFDRPLKNIPKSTSPQAPNPLDAVRDGLTAVRDGLIRVNQKPVQQPADGAPQDSKRTIPVSIHSDPVTTVPKLTDIARPAAVLGEGLKKVQEQTGPLRAQAEDVTRSITAPITTFASAVTTTVQDQAPEAPQAAPLVTGLLAAVGLSPLAGGTPIAPGPSPLAWALAAWTRRESDKDLNPEGEKLQSASDGEVPVADQPVTVQPMAATTEIAPQAAVASTWVQNPGQTTAPVISGSTTSQDLGWITGQGVTDQWYIAGTDLGIMWDSGYKDAAGNPIVYTMFGDTYSDPGMTGDWRNNVLLRSSDLNLNDGLTFSDAVINAGAQFPGDPNGVPTWWRPVPGLDRAGAMQIISDPGGLTGTTYTMIPTSAIALPKKDASGNPVLDAQGNPVMTQYATVMSIKQWGNPGSWTTNWSAIAVSEDGGKTWKVDKSTVRNSTGGNTNFQQNAMVLGAEDDPNAWTGPNKTGERYVYVYGTPSGRQGSAYVARVPESQITDLSKYQYFAGDNGDGTGKWVQGDPSQAVAVIGSEGTTGSIFPETGIWGAVLSPLVSFLKLVYPAGFQPGGIFSAGGSSGNVSEMSVMYNPYLKKYVVTYTDGGNNVVMRVSDSPQGKWSNTTTLQANTGSLPNTGMYAPMQHPLNGTSALGAGNEKNLYYNLSTWDNYNVRLMSADLSKLTIT